MAKEYTEADHETALKIEQALKKNKWRETVFPHPTREDLSVLITPCYYGMGLPARASDCEYFLMSSPDINLSGDEKILDVAKTVNDLPELIEKSDKSKYELSEFYEKRLAGHTDAQWALSSDVSSRLYKSWYEVASNVSFHDHFDKKVPEIAKELCIPEEVAKDAAKLSEDASFYSDWFKDCYGYRPRHLAHAEKAEGDKLFGGIDESMWHSAFERSERRKNVEHLLNKFEKQDAGTEFDLCDA